MTIVRSNEELNKYAESKVDKVSKQSLDSNSALRVSGTTVSLYKGDGTFDSITTQDTVYTLPTATSTVKGGIGIFSDTVQTVASNTVSATAGRTYGIQLNSAGQAVVNVPWVDNNTVYAHPNSGVTAGTYPKVTVNAQGHVTAGAGLSASDIPSLDASKITSGTIDPARLPSFVDDVLEFANLAGFPTTGEAGKIYIALDTNKSYRWSGSTYVYITSGAVDSVAGKTGVVTLVKDDVGLSLVDNTSDSAKNVLSATKLTTARTIELSGGATGTATSFDGTGNISISVTGLNASNLSSGTVPDDRLSGVYSGMSLKLNGNNTVFTTESSGSTNISRTVYGLAEYKNNSKTTTGAIVFIAPSSPNAVMHQLEVSGLLYDKNIVSLIVQGYRTTGAWSDLRKISTGTADIQVRWGVTPGGKNCLILGDVGTVWPYPHIAITRAMFSYSGLSDAYCTGWTVALVTDFTGYTNISANISDSTMTGNVSTATKLQTARTINGVSFDGTANIVAPTNLTVGTITTTAVPIESSSGTNASIPAATTELAGVMSSADKTKLDGVATGANNYTLPTATSAAIGGVKVSSTAQTVAANAVSATAAKTYAVQLDASGNAVVNVPWVNTNTTTTVENVLTSTSTTNALSAAQGKALNDTKANLNSPTFTGTPTAPTAASTVSSTQIATTAFAVPRTSTTGSARLPVGTTAQRDASPVDGMIRYNSTTLGFEGYFNGQWQSVGGGQMFGTALVKAVSYNAQTISENITVTARLNAYSVGDITINNGYSVVVEDNATYKIL